VALVNLLKWTAVENARFWNQLQPCFQSMQHQVIFRGLKNPMFYMLVSPHPSAFLTLLVIAFPLEKSSVWMLPLRDAAGCVR